MEDEKKTTDGEKEDVGRPLDLLTINLATRQETGIF